MSFTASQAICLAFGVVHAFALGTYVGAAWDDMGAGTVCVLGALAIAGFVGAFI